MPTYTSLEYAEREQWLPGIRALLELQRSREDNLLYIHPPAYYDAFTPDRGLYFAAWEGSVLVGFQMVGFANAIHPLWMPHIERIGGERDAFSVNLQALVHPDCRGHGLATILRRMALRGLRERGVRHSLVTTHPDNLANLRICAKLGYRELDRTIVYDIKVPRVLLHLDMNTCPWMCAESTTPGRAWALCAEPARGSGGAPGVPLAHA